MAMENGGLSASDVALMTNRGYDGWGGDGMGFMWIFALLVLAGGGFGGWGNNGFANAIGYNNLATQNDVQRGFDALSLGNQSRDILSAVTNGTAESVAATNQTFHDTLAVVSDKYNEITRDIGTLAVGQANALANQNQCCCDTRLLIQSTAADTNANLTAQIQSVKDMLAQNKIEALQSEVNQLQLAQATNGVLRFPNSWSYGAGPFPPIYGGCGCSNGFTNI